MLWQTITLLAASEKHEHAVLVARALTCICASDPPDKNPDTGDQLPPHGGWAGGCAKTGNTGCTDRFKVSNYQPRGEVRRKLQVEVEVEGWVGEYSFSVCLKSIDY